MNFNFANQCSLLASEENLIIFNKLLLFILVRRLYKHVMANITKQLDRFLGGKNVLGQEKAPPLANTASSK